MVNFITHSEDYTTGLVRIQNFFVIFSFLRLIKQLKLILTKLRLILTVLVIIRQIEWRHKRTFTE